MSPVQAGQIPTGSEPGSQSRCGAEEALRAPTSPGITVGGWTVRWVRDCWSVGRWADRKNRVRWKDATWHGQLDQALRRLLERCIRGEVHDLADVVERVKRVYREIKKLLRHVER